MAASSGQYPVWARSTEEVSAEFKVKLGVGLSDSEVNDRRSKHGYNELEKPPATPMWKLVLEQFDDTLVKILLFAAAVSFALAYFEESTAEEGIRAYIEPFVILLILILNAMVGVWQESNAEAALEALKDLQSDTAHVVRNGQSGATIPARDLVPGDIVSLHAGDKVPADIRVVELKTATLRAEQASLTGESVAVLKCTAPVSDENCEIQSKECMLFAGTAISNGSCVGIVTAIGMKTEIGKIQAQIQEAADEEEDTPLKKRLDHFGEVLAQVIFWICVLVWAINYHHFLTFEFEAGSYLPKLSTMRFSLAKATYYFKIAVALAVAAIPEGLPAVITTCLALGTRKMAKKNAIVRKLPSVETLGCTTIICSDKTGTLTTNQMSAVKLCAVAAGGAKTRSWDVSGNTYNPADGLVVGLKETDAALEAVIRVCALCNDSADIVRAGDAVKSMGAPTEVALVVLAEKLGKGGPLDEEEKVNAAVVSPITAKYRSQSPILSMLEFDRTRKSMSVIAKSKTGPVLLVKGGAEELLERCSRALLPDGTEVQLTAALKAEITKGVNEMADSTLRCIALAHKSGPSMGALEKYDGSVSHPGHSLLMDPVQYAGIESDLVFLGLAGLMDPPRPEVPGALRECRAAGIRVIVITGDNKATAEAICRKVGVFRPSQDLKDLSFTGREFMALSKDKQLAVLKAGKTGLCFSRAEPKHKQDIVRLLKEMGEVTAMTGDGVNDAPALKLADIGIAMGISGTEVAKEASDMVLADDNFSTIVAAVQEGRAIYNNMKAFIRYMISSNIGEVASIFITAMLGLPEGLIPVQLLWVNLVTDGPPATALGFNPSDPDIMSKPPRKADEPLITAWVFFRYIIIGTYVGVATVAAFVVWYMYDSFLGIDLSADGHSTVTWQQLVSWEECPSWGNFTATSYTAGSQVVSFATPCEYFTVGKAKASTLSLSVLVMIEMFNALNALSEDTSLLVMPFWSNPWLMLAITISTTLHCVILYIPFLAEIFSIVPLSLNEWALVVALAFPVIIIDEVLKFVGRSINALRSGSKAKQD